MWAWFRRSLQEVGGVCGRSFGSCVMSNMAHLSLVFSGYSCDLCFCFSQRWANWNGISVEKFSTWAWIKIYSQVCTFVVSLINTWLDFCLVHYFLSFSAFFVCLNVFRSLVCEYLCCFEVHLFTGSIPALAHLQRLSSVLSCFWNLTNVRNEGGSLTRQAWKPNLMSSSSHKILDETEWHCLKQSDTNILVRWISLLWGVSWYFHFSIHYLHSSDYSAWSNKKNDQNLFQSKGIW